MNKPKPVCTIIDITPKVVKPQLLIKARFKISLFPSGMLPVKSQQGFAGQSCWDVFFSANFFFLAVENIKKAKSQRGLLSDHCKV